MFIRRVHLIARGPDGLDAIPRKDKYSGEMGPCASYTVLRFYTRFLRMPNAHGIFVSVRMMSISFLQRLLHYQTHHGQNGLDTGERQKIPWPAFYSKHHRVLLCLHRV